MANSREALRYNFLGTHTGQCESLSTGRGSHKWNCERQSGQKSNKSAASALLVSEFLCVRRDFLKAICALRLFNVWTFCPAFSHLPSNWLVHTKFIWADRRAERIQISYSNTTHPSHAALGCAVIAVKILISSPHKAVFARVERNDPNWFLCELKAPLAHEKKFAQSLRKYFASFGPQRGKLWPELFCSPEGWRKRRLYLLNRKRWICFLATKLRYMMAFDLYINKVVMSYNISPLWSWNVFKAYTCLIFLVAIGAFKIK